MDHTTRSQEEKGVMDASTLFAPVLVYLAVLSAAGLLGNSTVLYIYFTKFQASTIRRLILTMALCDLFASLVSIPLLMAAYITNSTNVGNFCNSYRAVNSFVVVFSAFVLVVVAVERYTKVCQASNRHLTPRTTWVAMVICAVAAGVIAAWASIISGTKTVSYTDFNVTMVTCYYDEQFSQHVALKAFQAFSSALFVLCVLLMALSYALIARRLWQHNKQRRRTCPAVFVRALTPTPSVAGPGPQGCSVSWTQKTNRSLGPETEVAKPSVSVGSGLNIEAQMDEGESNNTEDETSAQNSSANEVSDSVDLAICDTETTSDTLTAERLENVNQAPPATGRCSRSSQHLREMSRKCLGKKIPGRTTLMMFVLTAVFVLSFLPNLVTMGRSDVDAGYWGLNLYHIARLFYYINSAVNPVIYGFCSPSFHRHCQHLVSCQ